MEREEIGSGTYSVVLRDGERAVKLISDNCETVVRELVFSTLCSHPNVIAYENVALHRVSIAMYMQLYDCDLRAYIKKGRVTPGQLYPIAQGILEGVAHIHACGVIHADIKPANILMDTTDCKPVITDFGISMSTLEPVHMPDVQSPMYRAPEIDPHSDYLSYGPEIDMWSVGCVLLEMAAGTSNLTQLKVYSQYFGVVMDKHGLATPVNRDDIRKRILGLAPHAPAEFIDLITDCLGVTPQTRISAQCALERLSGFTGVAPTVLPPRTLPLKELKYTKSIDCGLFIRKFAEALLDQYPENNVDDLLIKSAVYTAESIFTGEKTIKYRYGEIPSEDQMLVLATGITARMD